ncbi:MAG: alkaline phosphatase family protein, partial [Nitrospiraceae bacterium]
MKLLPQIQDQWVRMLAILLGMFAVVTTGLSVTGSAQTLRGEATHTAATSSQNQVQYIIMVALEGVGEDSLKGGSMPVLSRLVEHGSVTWSAAAVNPPLRLPTMTSLFTGLPVEKHGVTWNNFDFIRGYPRPPTVFDYLESSGGRDSAIFFMDESLYQLAKPEPYTDYRVCGRFRPECSTAMVVR